MSMFSKIVAIAAITASSAALAGAQGVTSATKPFSLGLSGGASISSGDLSNYVNTGYNVGGHVALGTPTLPISFRGDVNYDNFGAKGSGNSNVHIWSYTANAVYEVPTATGIRPYIIGGVGGFTPGSSTTAGGTTYSASGSTESGIYHLIDFRKDRLDILLRLDALDHEWKIERKQFHVIRRHAAACAESHDTAEHRCSSVSTVTKKVDNRLIQRLAVIPIPLTDVDAHEHALALQAMQHDYARLRKVSADCASAKPANVAIMDTTTLNTTYVPARRYWPPSINVAVS